jgi:hypothetical protein
MTSAYRSGVRSESTCGGRRPDQIRICDVDPGGQSWFPAFRDRGIVDKWALGIAKPTTPSPPTLLSTPESISLPQDN